MHGPLLGLRGCRERTPHLGFHVLRQLSGAGDQNLPGVPVCANSLDGEGFQSTGSKICALWSPAAPQGLPWGIIPESRKQLQLAATHSGDRLFWKPVMRQLPKASQTLTKGNATFEEHRFGLKFNSFISTMKKQMNTHCATQPPTRLLRELQL